MQTMKAFFSSLLSIGLATGAAFGQDVMPLADGRCEPGYFAYRQACVSRKALEEKGNAAVAQSIQEFLASLPPAPRARVCKTNVQELAGALIKFENGAIVETSKLALGRVRYRAEALLVSQEPYWKVALADKVFPVKILDEPWACDAPTSFPVEISAGTGSYRIRGKSYDAGAACAAWARGDEVVFLTGEGDTACKSTLLLNLTQPQSCKVTCK